ncbi:MAG: transposase [Caldicoprobacterales bacterium]|nr:transposase [Clostridiales bacterium]
MPRKARQKHEAAIYHIISRSFSEVLLFREDQDKEYYLMLLKRYAGKYHSSVYAYCLMDNHVHIHLDPKGYDISKFMHSLNTAYVRYYNIKYERHGHLFQGRFQSRILNSERYNLAVSAYIHNNPKDIAEYKGREEDYPYSSFGIYLNKRKDRYNLIDRSFIMGLLHANRDNFRRKYYELVKQQDQNNDIDDYSEHTTAESENEYISGRSVILRNISPGEVISYVSRRLGDSANINIAWKSKRKFINYRAFCAYVLRVLGGLSYREICRNIKSITIASCSQLCDKGYELINDTESIYSEVFHELIGYAA